MTRKQTVIKITLKGEVGWSKALPKETGKYDEDKSNYSPTNVNFMPDGGFAIGDGHERHYLHRYDKDSKWVQSWGGFGDKPGKIKTPHDHWLDDRPGRKPAIAVCDRANARLQYFSLEGKHLEFGDNLSFPADMDIRGEVMLVPDLYAFRFSIKRTNSLNTLDTTPSEPSRCSQTNSPCAVNRQVETRSLYPSARCLLRS
jgi:hypothetical protein